MYIGVKARDLEAKFLMDIKRAECSIRDKMKSVRSAFKLLKGKGNTTARSALRAEIARYKVELTGLSELETNINRDE